MDSVENERIYGIRKSYCKTIKGRRYFSRAGDLKIFCFSPDTRFY